MSVPLRRMDAHPRHRVEGSGPICISDQIRDPGICKEAAQICMFLTLRDMEDVATAQGLTQLLDLYSPSALGDLDPTVTS